MKTKKQNIWFGVWLGLAGQGVVWQLVGFTKPTSQPNKTKQAKRDGRQHGQPAHQPTSPPANQTKPNKQPGQTTPDPKYVMLLLFRLVFCFVMFCFVCVIIMFYFYWKTKNQMSFGVSAEKQKHNAFLVFHQTTETHNMCLLLSWKTKTALCLCSPVKNENGI